MTGFTHVDGVGVTLSIMSTYVTGISKRRNDTYITKAGDLLKTRRKALLLTFDPL